MIKCNYWCLDCDCGKKPRDTIVIEQNDEDAKDSFVVGCPFSESEKPPPLKFAGTSHVGGLAKFASASMEEKSRILKQRSRNHFQKEIKERKHQMENDVKKDVIENFRR